MNRLTALDGLRGLAILMVLAYHSLPYEIGHTGVDIFFVVSGFVLWLSLARNANPIDFLHRRLWRLVPAMVVLCFFISLILPLFFNAYSLTTFNRLYESLFFVSSFTDSQGANYFIHGFDTDVFAHAWSLSVEMCLVIMLAIGAAFWPLLNTPTKYGLLIGLTLASLALFTLPLYPDTYRFHLFPFRFWEFGLGMIAAVLYKRNIRFRFSILGLLLITLSLPLGPLHTLAASELAGLGTFLLLISAWPKWLSLKPLTFMGTVSYGTYLWHLPLLVLGKAAGLPIPLLIVSGVLAGTASWYFIEKPLKNGFAWGHTLWIGGGSFLIVLLTGAIGVSTLTPKAPAFDDGWKTCHLQALDAANPACLTDTPTVLLWGDSHAGVYAGALARVLEPNQIPYSIVTRNGCPPAGPSLVSGWTDYPGRNEEIDLCKQTQTIGRDQLEKADVVILTTHWTRQMTTQNCPGCAFEDDMKTLLDSLQNSDKTILLLGPVPEPGFPNYFYRDVRDPLGISLPIPTKQDTLSRTAIGRTWLDQNGYSYINLFDILCDDTTCPVVTKDDGYLFFDYDHLAPGGADKVIRSLPLPVSSGG